jgi:hypothetical protein
MKENTSIDHISLESRALNIQGTLQIFTVSSGKAHDSGYTKVRNGLETLGFRVTSLEPTGTKTDAQQADEQASKDEWLAMSIDRIIERLVGLSGRERVPGFSGMQVTPDDIRAVLVEVLVA